MSPAAQAQWEQLRAQDQRRLEETLWTSRLRDAGLPEAQSLDAYLTRYGTNTGNATALGYVNRFLAKVRSGYVPTSGFGFTGKPGCGKTTLLQATGYELLRHLDPSEVHYVSTRPLQGGMDVRSAVEAAAHYARYKVLLLDEVAQEQPFGWWVEKFLLNLVDERVRRGLPILYASTYPLEGLQERWGAPMEDGSTPEVAASLFSRWGKSYWATASMFAVNTDDYRTHNELDF